MHAASVRRVPALIIVRHAQSIWNAQGRWQGHADPPLSDLGELQAEAAARRLAAEGPFDLVVSSDLARARRTAEILAGGAEVAVEPLLREYDVGEWSSLTRPEIEERWPGALARFDEDRSSVPPGGEDAATFAERVDRAGAAVADLAGRNGAGRVLVVTHGGVIRSMARAAGLPERRVGLLSGYRGECTMGGLLPEEPFDLLECDDPREGHTPGVPSPL